MVWYIPVIIAVHGGSKSRLADVLQFHKKLDVRAAKDGDILRGGVIYVVPGATHAAVKDGHIFLSEPARQAKFRPSIDALFVSLAMEYKQGAIGIVLSGTLNDGMKGAQILYEMGGITIAQDPDDAQFNCMPQSVITHDHPEDVLSAKHIGAWLQAYCAERARLREDHFAS